MWGRGGYGGRKTGGRSAGSASPRKGGASFRDDTPDPDAQPYLKILGDTEVVSNLIFQYLDSRPSKSAPAKEITLFVVLQIFDSDHNLRRLNAVGAASELLKDARMQMKEEGFLLYDPETQLWSINQSALFFPPDRQDLAFLKRGGFTGDWQKALRKDDVAVWLCRALTPDGFEYFCATFLSYLGCVNVSVSQKRDISEKIRGVDGGIDGYGFMSPREDPTQRLPMAFQSKKYGSRRQVGEPDVRDFAGALMGAEIPYGFFITTGTFSESARAYLERLKTPQIAAFDGRQIIDQMLPRPGGPGFGALLTDRNALLVNPSFLLRQAGM